MSRSSVISCIAYLGPSRPRPLSLTPPNGMRSTRLLDDSLTWTTPTCSRSRRVHGAGDVAREDAGGQAERRRVDLGDRLVERSERDDRHHRREDLLAHDAHARARDPVEDRRMEQRARPPAAVHHRRAVPHRFGDPGLGAPRFAFADHRADVGVRVARIADLDAAGRRRPAAPRTRSTTASCTNSRCVEVHTWPARRNAERRTAAPRDRDRRPRRRSSPRCCRAPARPAAGRPIAASIRPTRVLPVNVKKRMSGFSTSHGPDLRARSLHRARRARAASRPRGGARRAASALSGVALRRLDHDGVARRQGGRDLVRHHVQRRVERRDAADDAARHADREGHPVRLPGAPSIGTISPRQPLGFLGGDEERLDRPADFRVGVGDREARFGDDAIDEVPSARSISVAASCRIW